MGKRIMVHISRISDGELISTWGSVKDVCTFYRYSPMSFKKARDAFERNGYRLERVEVLKLSDKMRVIHLDENGESIPVEG